MGAIVNNPLTLALIIGFILDSLIGDPYKLPHPIRLFGTCISKTEKAFNKYENRKFKGAITSFLLITITGLSLFFAFKWLESYYWLHLIFTYIGVFYGLANHSLIKEAYRIEQALQKQGIEQARKQLSYIVGRETKNLSAQQIRLAILETLAENLSDGVIAPLFYYAIGGIPLLFTYKMINTLDSMIGYKSERYFNYGWFAAKTDDVVNYLPARITALLMAIVTFSLKGFVHIFKYGHKHSSPNAGYPEAALSGILDVQFGGPNYYYGKLIEKPFIGNNPKTIKHKHIVKACLINVTVSTLSVFIICIVLNTLT